METPKNVLVSLQVLALLHSGGHMKYDTDPCSVQIDSDSCKNNQTNAASQLNTGLGH